VPAERSLQSLESYIATSQELRPEFTQLKEGLAARKELITVAKRDYLPVIFLGAFLYAANADNRTDIENPFIVDPFNDTFATAVLGLKWNLNFATVTAKVQAAEAEYRKLLEKKSFAEAGIPVQVEKAYREILEAQKNMVSTEASYKAARQWLVAAQSNFDLGIGEAKEIADAFTEFLKMRAENFRSIYSYNLALARLDQTTGTGIQKFSR
jgi:outer membrane protein TolC